jgi:hypothetical protein
MPLFKSKSSKEQALTLASLRPSFAYSTGKDRSFNEFAHLEKLAHWLDDGFRVPTLGLRFGWDAIAKMLPVFGDTLGLIASLYLFQALRRMNLPRITRTRMLTNIAIDYVVGLLPFVGVLFDVYWKPNVWNVGLARRHLSATSTAQIRHAHRRDWLFVLIAALVVIALLCVTFAAAYWLLSQLVLLLGHLSR